MNKAKMLLIKFKIIAIIISLIECTFAYKNRKLNRFVTSLNHIITPKKLREKNNIAYRIYIGMISAFAFWLPLFSFALHELVNIYVYMCVSIIVIVAMCYVFYRAFAAANLLKNPAFILYVFTFLSIFIMSLLHKNSYILTSLFYPLTICIFLFLDRRFRFWFGFFVGVFGLYWITLSFRFYGIGWAIPFVIICIGIVIAIMMYFLLFFNDFNIRFLALLSLFIIHPFGFNWLNVAYLSSYSVFSAFHSLLLIPIAIYVIYNMKYVWKYLSFVFLILSFNMNFTTQEPKLKIKVVQTHYAQDNKWSKESLQNIIDENLKEIQSAIDEKYEIVVLPETSFPFSMREDSDLYFRLLDMSRYIIIVFGALRYMDYDFTNNHHDVISLDSIQKQGPAYTTLIPDSSKGYYNSIFILSNATGIIADKINLVPFGETLPFNSILAPIYEKIMGETFGFNAGKDTVKLSLHNNIISLANCYEGTTDMPYKGNVDSVIMLSNNAWFYPSLQPFLQKMIIKYYAVLNHSFVYHSTNYTQKAIISPNNWLDFNKN